MSIQTRYTITSMFTNNIDEEHCQPAPKFLLTAMREVNNKNGYFTQDMLTDWMEQNINNNVYIKYNGRITSLDNLKKYWRLAHLNRNDNSKTAHNARILNIESYYKIV